MFHSNVDSRISVSMHTITGVLSRALIVE